MAAAPFRFFGGQDDQQQFFPSAPPILPTPDFSDFGKSELYRIQGRKNRFFFSPIVSTSRSSSLISPSPPHNNKEEGEERRKMTFLHPGLGIWQFSSEPPGEKKGENGGQGLNLRHFDNEGPGLRPRARTVQVETEAARGGKKGNHCAYCQFLFSHCYRRRLKEKLRRQEEEERESSQTSPSPSSWAKSSNSESLLWGRSQSDWSPAAAHASGGEGAVLNRASG